MLSNSVLYRIWRERLSQLIPEDCKYHRYRLTNMLLLIVGIYKATVIVSEIGDATRFPGPKQLCSFAGRGLKWNQARA